MLRSSIMLCTAAALEAATNCERHQKSINSKSCPPTELYYYCSSTVTVVVIFIGKKHIDKCKMLNNSKTQKKQHQKHTALQIDRIHNCKDLISVFIKHADQEASRLQRGSNSKLSIMWPCSQSIFMSLTWRQELM